MATHELRTSIKRPNEGWRSTCLARRLLVEDKQDRIARSHLPHDVNLAGSVLNVAQDAAVCTRAAAL